MASLNTSSHFAMKTIRNRSLATAGLLGYRVSAELPLLEELSVTRTPQEVTKRMLCVFCVVAVANNSSAPVAIEWAIHEGLMNYFSEDELAYLRNPSASAKAVFLAQEEALWALTWAAGFHEDLDYSRYCDNRLAAMFPNVRKAESSVEFARKIKLRAAGEIAAALDLAYCLHWAIVNEHLHGNLSHHTLEQYAIIERRRALEWLVGDGNWSEVVLDT